MMIKFLFLTCAFFLVTACVTRLPVPEGVPEISVGDYETLIDQKSRKLELYDGLYHQLTIQATWLDSQISLASLSHNARLQQWTATRYNEEKSKVIIRHTESTEFFVSFYTPERKSSDLSSNKKLWQIFLDVNGTRYEGKATKVKQMLSEIQAIYPYHNRWSVPYILSFPVATSLVENKKANLILTGAISSAQVLFNEK